jgi:hypothetical protein
VFFKAFDTITPTSAVVTKSKRSKFNKAACADPTQINNSVSGDENRDNNAVLENLMDLAKDEDHVGF